MRLPEFPTRESKDEVLAVVRQRLSEQLDSDIRQAFEACVVLLESNEENRYFIADDESEVEESNEIYRQQLLPLRSLPSIRSRVTAIMCVDYLNGNEESKLFTKIDEKSLEIE